MAAQFPKHYVQDLQQDIKIRQCGTIVFNADNLSNVIEIELYNGTEAYSGGGSVSCSVIAPDGATVPVTGGTLSGNVVSVTLTGDCFAIPGQIGVGVQVVNGTQKTTVLKAIYNVELLDTDTVVDPGSRLTTSVADLENRLTTVINSFPADLTDLLAAIAPTFSNTKAYTAGQYVWQDGKLYKFTSNHAAGSWTGTPPTDATLVALGNDVSDLKSAVTQLDNGIFIIDESITWTNAYVNVNGKLTSSPWSKTGLFVMHAGETLIIGTKNPNITIIGSTTEDSLSVGDTVTVIQRTSSTDQYEEYTYTATATINIVVCVLAANYNLMVTKKSGIQTQIDTINSDIDSLEEDVNEINTTIEVLDSKNIKSKTLVNSGTAESIWETNAIDLSEDDDYYIYLISVSGVNVSTNPYMAVRNVYSDSTQVITNVKAIGQLIKIGFNTTKTYTRTNIVCYRADSTVGTSVNSSWEYVIFKGTPNKSKISALIEQANKATTDIGKYTFSFYSSSGNSHSSSSDKININIPHNNACTIVVSLDITPSGTYECWATYSDNTTERIISGYFGTMYTITPPKNITAFGIAIGSQSGAYTCTIQLETNTTTGIVDLNSYGYNALLQAKRTINTTANGYLSAVQPLVLFHFSDIHGGAENLRRIVAFRDKYADLIDDTICTGDMVKDRFSSGMSFWDAVPGAEDIMMVVGNHDALAAASGYDWTDLKTEAEQYGRYISPYVSNWDCEYTENKTYYYKDYASKKVRLICLNCMLTGDDNTAQLTWFASTLADAITNDYYVIVAVHYPISNHTTVSCGFSSIDTIPSQTQNRLSDDYMSAVNTFVGNGGKFVCYLTGHTHTDFILKSSNYSGQMCIVIDSASYSAGNADSDTQRTIATKSYDCANLFVFDSASGAIKIIRVGADMDHYMRPKNDITFKLSDLSIITAS